jgi:hypothetical protein
MNWKRAGRDSFPRGKTSKEGGRIKGMLPFPKLGNLLGISSFLWTCPIGFHIFFL